MPCDCYYYYVSLAACHVTHDAACHVILRAGHVTFIFLVTLAACHVTLAACHVTLAACHVTLAACHVTLAACYVTLAAYHVTPTACHVTLAACHVTLAACLVTLAACLVTLAACHVTLAACHVTLAACHVTLIVPACHFQMITLLLRPVHAKINHSVLANPPTQNLTRLALVCILSCLLVLDLYTYLRSQQPKAA